MLFRSQNCPPKSEIEIQIKKALLNRHHLHQDTIFTWVRGHIGIPGNEEADQEALLHSLRGPQIQSVTYSGLRAHSRNTRAQERHVSQFGKNRSLWHRTAMSAYTWLRCDKGPMKARLHTIGKAPDPACPCGHLYIARVEPG